LIFQQQGVEFMQSVSAIQNLPTAYPASKPLAQGVTARPAAASSGSSSSTSSNSVDASSIGTTFLTLLSQELQNQDPTAPMDSTAMVGQMISLNQLDQLISINQILSNVSGSSSTTGTSAAVARTAAAQATPSAAASVSAPTAAQASQLPFDPATMMPWNYGNSNAAPVSAASGLSGNLNLNAAGRK
jgi:flagellar basal-body rod modification protein FlgD